MQTTSRRTANYQGEPRRLRPLFQRYEPTNLIRLDANVRSDVLVGLHAEKQSAAVAAARRLHRPGIVYANRPGLGVPYQVRVRFERDSVTGQTGALPCRRWAEHNSMTGSCLLLRRVSGASAIADPRCHRIATELNRRYLESEEGT